MAGEQVSGRANGDPLVPTHEHISSPLHAMVVDDHAGVRAQYERIFSIALGNGNFTTFPNGQEALAWFEADPQKAHLLWTDNDMPGMSGVELIAKVHEVNPTIVTVLATMNARGLKDLSPEELQARGIDVLYEKGERNIFNVLDEVKGEATKRKESPTTK